MGRSRTANPGLPPGLRARPQKSGRVYYYLEIREGGRRRELPVGSDYERALRAWAREARADPLDRAPDEWTFSQAADHYMAHARARLAPRTLRDYERDLKRLLEVFGDRGALLSLILPAHIAQYRDHRDSTHSTHELALLSAIYNWAREHGGTSAPNPAVGVRRNRGKGRDVYVDDAVFEAVYAVGSQELRDAMDLAWACGLRPGDALRLAEDDVKDGVLHVSPGKTERSSRKKARVQITGRLEATLTRILEKKERLMRQPGGRPAVSRHLLTDESGQALTPAQLDGRFEKARAKAVRVAVSAGDDRLAAAIRAFQFRDLRAKAATEVEEALGIDAARDLLVHTDSGMTRRYVRHRQGKLVKPVK